MTLYLKDATFVDWQSLDVRKTCIAVEEGRQMGFPSYRLCRDRIGWRPGTGYSIARASL